MPEIRHTIFHFRIGKGIGGGGIDVFYKNEGKGKLPVCITFEPGKSSFF